MIVGVAIATGTCCVLLIILCVNRDLGALLNGNGADVRIANEIIMRLEEFHQRMVMDKQLSRLMRPEEITGAGDCPVCLEPANDTSVRLPCSHHLHTDCLRQCIERTDPGSGASPMRLDIRVRCISCPPATTRRHPLSVEHLLGISPAIDGAIMSSIARISATAAQKRAQQDLYLSERPITTLEEARECIADAIRCIRCPHCGAPYETDYDGCASLNCSMCHRSWCLFCGGSTRMHRPGCDRRREHEHVTGVEKYFFLKRLRMRALDGYVARMTPQVQAGVAHEVMEARRELFREG